MTTRDIIFGPHVLETLSIGMYSNPLIMYREYIQNSSDALDEAIKMGVIKPGEGEIRINIDRNNQIIQIRDNGVGVKADYASSILLDVANSQKKYDENRGFRGIGRLCALGCSSKLIFETSYLGENEKTILTWDGEELLRLLSRGNEEVLTALEVIERVTKLEKAPENPNLHYFEVRLESVFPRFAELMSETMVDSYVSDVAPVPFDSQMFCFANKIKGMFKGKNVSFDEYKIYINNSPKPVYKRYKTSVKTGHQERNKRFDQIKDVNFIEGYNSTNELIYLGWYAITNFYGSVNDPFMQGIRIRKGNILIGEKDTFAKFFPSEGDRANTWFIGEIYIVDSSIIPNSQRDDFERNEAYVDLFEKLSKFADSLNKNHRRLMSDFHSAVNSINNAIKQINEIEKTVQQKGVTSDTQRDHFIRQREDAEKTLDKKRKDLARIISRNDIDETYKVKGEQIIEHAQQASIKAKEIENEIVDADYATKNDLPSSYSRAEKKIYQRIIAVIDDYFNNDKTTAAELRKVIIDELAGRKLKKK